MNSKQNEPFRSASDDVSTNVSSSILSLSDVQYRGLSETSVRFNGFTGQVKAGQFVTIPLQRHQEPREAASMMLGLVQQDDGTILCEGHDWLDGDFEHHFKLRSKIGRVFTGAGWMQSLTIRDNIELALLHQRIKKVVVKAKVRRWTEKIALDRVDDVRRALRKRPSVVEPSVLQVCQFIRALCNNPRLLILERPLRFLDDSLREHILSVIDELRDRGTAVLCFSGESERRSLEKLDDYRRWNLATDTPAVAGEASA